MSTKKEIIFIKDSETQQKQLDRHSFVCFDELFTFVCVDFVLIVGRNFCLIVMIVGFVIKPTFYCIKRWNKTPFVRECIVLLAAVCQLLKTTCASVSAGTELPKLHHAFVSIFVIPINQEKQKITRSKKKLINRQHQNTHQNKLKNYHNKKWNESLYVHQKIQFRLVGNQKTDYKVNIVIGEENVSSPKFDVIKNKKREREKKRKTDRKRKNSDATVRRVK